MVEKKLRWIHLSDIHIYKNIDNNIKQKRMFKALFNDIRNFIEKGFKPDFIAITGDIAFSGKKDEYNLALSLFLKPLLKITGIPQKRLILIPGNHDANRDISKQIKSPLDIIKTDIDIDHLFSGRFH